MNSVLMNSIERLTVLIVSQSDEVESLKKQFAEVEEYDIETISAETYAEGTEMFIEMDVDICFLRAHFGEKSGKHFLRSLKKLKEQTPIVLICEEEPDQQLLEDDAINDYILIESATKEVLSHSIRHAFENNEAQLTLKAHEEIYNNLFYGSLEPTFMIDENYDVVEYNESFRQLLKIEKGDSFNLAEMFVESDETCELLKEVTSKESKSIRKTRLQNRAGEELIGYFSISPLKSEVLGASHMGIIHDITELEHTQARLAESEQSAMIHRMARIIGHEVRNPLTNILLATEEIKTDIGEDEDQAIMLDMIQRNAKRISTLIDNFLKNARTADIVKNEVSLESVVSEAVKVTYDRLVLKRIEFDQKGLDGRTLLFLDKEKIGIALTNILINAVEALETTESPTLKVSIESKDAEVQVSIEDNGVGMDDETLANLFNPFYSNKQGGLGLGMANAKSIFRAHDAQISVESELNQGTKFTISFKTVIV
ncbi:MAG: ATP-binding protein [Fluviicola sp.]